METLGGGEGEGGGGEGEGGGGEGGGKGGDLCSSWRYKWNLTDSV